MLTFVNDDTAFIKVWEVTSLVLFLKPFFLSVYVAWIFELLHVFNVTETTSTKRAVFTTWREFLSENLN